jgi:hypothetical protein
MKGVRGRVRKHESPVRVPISRTTDEEQLRKPRPAAPQLSSVLGNRAVSRMVAANRGLGSEAPIQRYAFEGTQWNMTNGVSRSGDGASGVVFFVDGSQNPLVTKAANDPPRETLFATAFYNKLGNKRGITTPQTRLATPDERGQIAAQIEEKAMWKQDEVAADVQSFRVGGRPHVWVQGMAKGKALGSKRKEGRFQESAMGTNRIIELFEDPDYVRNLGFVTICDMFIGNGDRIDVGNLGNWMTDTSNAISLIDNFTTSTYQGLTRNREESWESLFLNELKPSGYAAKAAGVYDHLLNMMPSDVKTAFSKSSSMSADGRKKNFVKNYTKGMQDGRKAILAKLAPTFGKRSRSLKASVGDDEGAAEAWGMLKRRALRFKNLS